MNCTNSECMKVIRNYYPCSKCGFKFCSNSCLTEHTLEQHSSNHYKDTNDFRISFVRSPFIKSGKFLKEIAHDPYFDFKNFISVKKKDGKSKKIIGTGAMGNVFLARNKIDEKLFAIKQIKKKKLIETGANMEIIQREILVHQRIRHENIVQLYSSYEDEKNVYLIMEYSDKGTLFNFISDSQGCDEKKAFHYFIQVASAVYFLHENNLIHRDIKPENLLIDKHDNIKLCDFGWCVDMSKGSRITFCGTYEYMAPEIIQEMPYNKSIDVWSLGILLYELIHGYSPFRAQSEHGEEEEYHEIFKNIIKYNFQIDKDISKYCSDLITSKLFSLYLKLNLKF
jgi:serine/threonine protein kinase